MESPLISIIVPAYNAESYLHRCIDSILNQTYTNFELLITNDGSTDATKDICDEYASKDHRIIVFHQKNGGVSSARNHGLDNVHGEWIMFVDADDYIPKDAIEKMVEQSKDSDCLYFCFGLLWESEDYIEEFPCNLSHKTYKFDVIIRAILRYEYITGPVAKLIKKSILDTIRFNENLSIGEDLLFNIEIALKVKKIKICDGVVYNYTNNPNSAMHSEGIFDKYVALSTCINNYFKEHNIADRYLEELKYFEIINLTAGFVREPKRIIVNYSLAKRLKSLSKTCSITSSYLQSKGIRLLINFPLIYYVYAMLKTLKNRIKI